MDISGYVVLGIVTLFLVYLMPQLIRSRQDVVDSRLADRFSADLRILATAGTAGGGSRLATDDSAQRAYLHDPRLRTEVSAMNRPITRVTHPVTSDSVNLGDKRESNSRPAPALAQRPQVTAGSAPGPAPQGGVVLGSRPAGPRSSAAVTPPRGPARPEVARRRKAAARRRLILTLVLLALSAGAWIAVATGAAHLALATAPTVLLAVVLVLGRRAAAAGARADRAARVAPARPARPVAIAPKDSRPEATASRGSARPASRPAGRDARAAHAGTTQVLAAQRQNTNAQRPAAQNGGVQAGGGQAPQAPVAPSRVAATSTPSRASREAGTEIIPRVRPAMTEGGIAEALRWSGEPSAPQAIEVEATPVEEGAMVLGAQADVAVPEVEDVAVSAAVQAPSNRSWTPVPVPVPTYTLKPTAPRLSPPALSAVEGGPAAVEPAAEPTVTSEPAATGAASDMDSAARATEALQAAQAAQALEAVGVEARGEIDKPAAAAAAEAGGLDLDAVLSRRRASGE